MRGGDRPSASLLLFSLGLVLLYFTSEDVVHREAVGVERDPGAEPGLRVLAGELRRDPERRAVLLPGQPRVPRRRRHEPLLRLQRQARLELLLQQLRARRAVRSKLWFVHVLLTSLRRSPDGEWCPTADCGGGADERKTEREIVGFGFLG